MVKFIAEVSSNHAQDLGRSLAFVDAAAACGFDAVKFQLFRVAELFAPEILAPFIYYARKFTAADGSLREESDRYAQALVYKRIARECFDEARRQL